VHFLPASLPELFGKVQIGFGRSLWWAALTRASSVFPAWSKNAAIGTTGLTDAWPRLIQRKIKKFEAPVKTLRRAQASHRGIKHEQFVADVRRCRVVWSTGATAAQTGSPAVRAIVASGKLRLAEAGVCVRVRRYITEDPTKNRGGPASRPRSRNSRPSRICVFKSRGA